MKPSWIILFRGRNSWNGGSGSVSLRALTEVDARTVFWTTFSPEDFEIVSVILQGVMT